MDETYTRETSTPKTDAPATGPGQSAVRTAAHEAGSVAATTGDQVKQVATTAGEQTKNVAADLRTHLTQEARTQQGRLADGLRQTAGELDRMAGQGGESPARSVVARLAESGHEAADYLGKHGPEEVLDEVRDFARRRPGAFLATAAVTGFVLGRLGRAIFDNDTDGSGSGKPDPAGAKQPHAIPVTTGNQALPAPDPGPGSTVGSGSTAGTRFSGSSGGTGVRAAEAESEALGGGVQPGRATPPGTAGVAPIEGGGPA